jgi:hypothetical protein
VIHLLLVLLLGLLLPLALPLLLLVVLLLVLPSQVGSCKPHAIKYPSQSCYQNPTKDDHHNYNRYDYLQQKLEVHLELQVYQCQLLTCQFQLHQPTSCSVLSQLHRPAARSIQRCQDWK